VFPAVAAPLPPMAAALDVPAAFDAGPGPPGAAAVLPALPVVVAGALAPAAVAGLPLPAAALPACVPWGTLLVPTPGASPPPQPLAMISVRAKAPCNAGMEVRLP
jgi:hypothetical protein